MPLFAFVGLSAIIMLATLAWGFHTLSSRPRYRPCGYRMVRPNRAPVVVVSNGFGVGLFSGLGFVMLGIAILGQ